MTNVESTAKATVLACFCGQDKKQGQVQIANSGAQRNHKAYFAWDPITKLGRFVFRMFWPLFAVISFIVLSVLKALVSSHP